MEINKVKTKKIPILDGIELKSATFIDKNFPLHFHQSWSLAFIEYGSENISFNHFDFLLNKNAIILIPPYSLHKNWGNKNSAWAYKAIYISNGVIKTVSKKLFTDYSHLASFPYFLSYCNNGFEINEKSIFNILENLFLNALDDNNQCASH